MKELRLNKHTNLALVFGLALLISIFTCTSLLTQHVVAISGTDFNAGRIIDDTVFYNKSTMSAQQIQEFLNAKVPSCDTMGTKPSGRSGYATRADWGRANSYAPPYTCLKDYKMNVPSVINSGSDLCKNSIVAGSKSAAQIIYDVSQACDINPQVLIVLLQKEQSLITDEWPWSVQYRSATGYGCPDTAPCDAEYYGFFNQVYQAAKAFNRYAANPTNYNYRSNRNNIILYNPNTACGSSTVFIENQASASLYIYTPYQPNQAALNNLYGTGDACSSYGNRNFWRIFNDWFGSTKGTPFFQLPGSTATYIYGANNTYYYIRDYERLKDYGFETVFNHRLTQLVPSEITNLTFKGDLPPMARFEDAGIFVAQSGKLHPFTSEEMFYAYGYNFGQEATLQRWIQFYLTQGQPMARVVLPSNGYTAYFIENGKKRPFCNWDAFTKLGTPTYSSLGSVILSTHYIATLPFGQPIASQGDLIMNSDTNSYGIWQNSSLTSVEQTIAKNSDAVNCAVPNASYGQLPASPRSINNLIQSFDGKYYIIDRNRKLELRSTELASYGLLENDFIAVDDAFLHRLTTSPMSNAIRQDDNIAVYAIREGKAYGIPTESDFYGLGYASFNQVQKVTNKTMGLFEKRGYIYKTGRLIRESNSMGVYLISDSFTKHAFTSEGMFFNYGYKWSDILVVPPGSLSAYADASFVSSYAKDIITNDYWIVDGGSRRRLASELIGQAYYNPDGAGVVSLPSIIINKIPQSANATKVFRKGRDIAVYLIEDGRKRPIASEQAFFRLGYAWNDVMPLSQTYVKSIPTGDIIY